MSSVSRSLVLPDDTLDRFDACERTRRTTDAKHISQHTVWVGRVAAKVAHASLSMASRAHGSTVLTLHLRAAAAASAVAAATVNLSCCSHSVAAVYPGSYRAVPSQIDVGFPENAVHSFQVDMGRNVPRLSLTHTTISNMSPRVCGWVSGWVWRRSYSATYGRTPLHGQVADMGSYKSRAKCLQMLVADLLWTSCRQICYAFNCKNSVTFSKDFDR